jgi:hypothetical protein
MSDITKLYFCHILSCPLHKASYIFMFSENNIIQYMHQSCFFIYGENGMSDGVLQDSYLAVKLSIHCTLTLHVKILNIQPTQIRNLISRHLTTTKTNTGNKSVLNYIYS